MQLRKYEAPNINEAFRLIKADLGDDAVIFSSRAIESKHASDVKGTSWIEVTAAVERKRSAPVEPQSALPATYTESIVGRPRGYNESAGENMTTSSRFDEVAGFFPPEFSSYYDMMIQSGFQHDVAWYLLGKASAGNTSEKGNGELDEVLLRQIGDSIQVGGPITLRSEHKRVIALLGPTGVGKTTTLAKIAAHCSKDPKIKVKVVTTDTYRIAAVEQLKVYARIMNLPFNVAPSTAELHTVLRGDDDTNLVLIDTAGKNFKNQDEILEMNKWLFKFNEIETHLLLSATTDKDVLATTLNNFKKSRADRLIITKVDESERQGRLFNLIASSNIPLSYITTGQRVPEDIRPASKKLVSSLFLKGLYN